MHVKETKTNMTNEEKYLRDHIGKGNPFRVPEGYFDSLVPSVMEQLPEQQPVEIVAASRVSLIYRLRPLLYAAACVLIAVFSVVAFMDYDSSSEQDMLQIAAVQNTTVSDTYIDEVADYVMVDNTDIYACLINE